MVKIPLLLQVKTIIIYLQQLHVSETPNRIRCAMRFATVAVISTGCLDHACGLFTVAEGVADVYIYVCVLAWLGITILPTLSKYTSHYLEVKL